MATSAVIGEDVLTAEERGEALDKAALEKLVREARIKAYESNGYADAYGQPDPDRLRRKTVSILMENPVESRDERADKALTRHALTARLFPNVPAEGTDEYEAGGAVAAALWKKLAGDAWRATDPKSSSSAQKLLGRIGDGAVLVRCTIPVGADMNSTMAQAAYVTQDEDALLRDYAKPLKEAVNKVAEQMAKDLGMVAERNPELAERLTREIEGGMKVATNLARSTLALSTGSETP
jgi:hypothetical protein